jgi:hypothetical protein
MEEIRSKPARPGKKEESKVQRRSGLTSYFPGRAGLLLTSGSQPGITMIFVMVFGVALSLVVAGLVSLSMYQLHALEKKIVREKALHIAEAGLYYYKWFLAHFPTNVQNGTGVPGPYVVNFTDPSGTVLGTYSLTITGNYQCNELTSVDIKSKGTVANQPTYTRTVSARSSYPSTAEYSFITNGPINFGSGSTTTGPAHSNSGINMGGTHNSLISSAVSTWTCTVSYGCSPTTTKPGVFGATGNPSLWRFPVSSINFATMVDFAAMKTRAQTYGLYFANYSANTLHNKGYHVIFRSDGRIDVYRVTATSGSLVSGTTYDYHTITAETFLGTYTIPATCSVVYIEDNVWVEGVVKGKITLVANDVVVAGNAADIVIQNNLTRLSTSGADGVTLIAERNVLLSAVAPNNMTVEGIFVALSGMVGRNSYASSVPTTIRSSLTRVGTIVSYLSPVLAYSSGGTLLSGFQTRVAAYDRALVFSPPPFTPNISTKTRLIRWREEEGN